MATFGKLTDGASSSTSSADSKIASSAIPSTNGTVESLTARVWCSSGSSVSRAIIYSDSAGVPNTLLAQSDNLTVSNTTEAANTFTFSGANAIDIVAGTTYWIGVHFTDPGVGNYTWSRDGTAGKTAKASDTFADGTASTWGTNSALAGPIDFFVTYTEPVAGITVTPNTASLTTTTYAPTVTATVSPPATVLDIGLGEGQNHFKVQFGREGAASPVEYSLTSIANGFSEDPYFIATPTANAVQFYAPVDGPTTSGSEFARSELREMNIDDTEIAFDPTIGQHILHGRFKITHLPPVKPDIIVAQLHNGTTGDRISLRTQLVSGLVKLVWRINGSGTGIPRVSEDFAAGTEVEYKIHVSNNTIQLFINDMTTPYYQSAAGILVSSATYYFKTGNYNQTNTTTDAATEYGSTELRDLYHWHTGWTTPTGRTIDSPIATVTPITASLTTATFAPSVSATANQSVTPGTATVTIATFAPTASATANVSVTPNTATIATTSFAPSVAATANMVVTPTTASLTITTQTPIVSVGNAQSVVIGTASLTTATFAPSVALSNNQFATPATASLVTATFAPGVTATANVVVTPNTTALVLSSQTPTVTTGGNQAVVIGTLILTTNRLAPNVALSNNQVVTPAFASLITNRFAPNVTATNNQVVTPTPATLSTNRFAPTLAIGNAVTVTPGVAAMIFAMFTPSVTTGGVATGRVKIWNGSVWVSKPVKVWNGSAWVVKPVKQWNGSAWVKTLY